MRAVAGDRAEVYGDGCHLNAGEVHAKECIYGDAGAPRVVLFGDSHAAQWFPALLGWAEESGMAVESHTKSSCAATMAQPVLNGVEYWQCEAWRAEVLQRIAEDPPELVVISNLADTNGQGSADDLGSALRHGFLNVARARMGLLEADLKEAGAALAGLKKNAPAKFLAGRVARVRDLNRRAGRLLDNPVLQLLSNLG